MNQRRATARLAPPALTTGQVNHLAPAQLVEPQVLLHHRSQIGVVIAVAFLFKTLSEKWQLLDTDADPDTCFAFIRLPRSASGPRWDNFYRNHVRVNYLSKNSCRLRKSRAMLAIPYERPVS
jgi:hypothetical protein